MFRKITLALAAVVGFGLVGSQAAQAGNYGHGYYGHNDYRGNPGYGAYRNSYYGGYCQPRWHDTSHLHWHPGSFQRHYDHFHYVPGHYDVHRTGHWHW